MKNKPFRHGIKRTFDVIVAAAVLLASMPLLICVALLIRWKMGSPVFFRQRRPGLRSEPFEMIKFRTMRPPRDDEEASLTDSQRLTGLGRFLRKTSIDELPELWNVLRGEMSLVGPRPLLMEYQDRYTPEQARRHEVKPGITGWAQVNGRNAIRWDEKFLLDVWYVDHVNLWVDLCILAKTAWKVLCREGISAIEHPTMPEFAPNSKMRDAA